MQHLKNGLGLHPRPFYFPVPFPCVIKSSGRTSLWAWCVRLPREVADQVVRSCVDGAGPPGEREQSDRDLPGSPSTLEGALVRVPERGPQRLSRHRGNVVCFPHSGHDPHLVGRQANPFIRSKDAKARNPCITSSYPTPFTDEAVTRPRPPSAKLVLVLACSPDLRAIQCPTRRCVLW